MLDIFTSKDLDKFKKIKPNEKNIIKIAKFISLNFKHINHSFEYKRYPFEQLNIFKLVNVYGYGNCKHFAFLFSFFMDLLNIKSEIIFSKYKFYSHVFNIIYLDGKKYIIDTDFGIIEKKAKLIEFDKITYDKTFIEDIYKFYKANRKEKYANRKIFKSEFYFNNLRNELDYLIKSHKNLSIFSLYSNIFPYKKQLSKYQSKPYFFNEPYLTINPKLLTKKISPKRIILKNRIVKTKGNFTENCLLEIVVNDFKFTLNDFPFLIIDLKLITRSNAKYKIFLNDKQSTYETNKFILKKRKLLKKPIYNFYLESNERIKKIHLIIQKSRFKQNLMKLLN